MNNVTYIPALTDQNGRAHYATPCPVYIHPKLCEMDSEGKYPELRALEQSTGMAAEIDEKLSYTLNIRTSA